mmetsp:Transcript_3209/g.10854  ORF Transcript_3209/g.10854 Transcript_3209/m.10854 type:complete len:210 (-) Transcript_3209:153-782(-)
MPWPCEVCKLIVEVDSDDANKCAGGLNWCCNCARGHGLLVYETFACIQCKDRDAKSRWEGRGFLWTLFGGNRTCKNCGKSKSQHLYGYCEQSELSKRQKRLREEDQQRYEEKEEHHERSNEPSPNGVEGKGEEEKSGDVGGSSATCQEEEEKEERPTKRARVNGCGVEQGKEEGSKAEDDDEGGSSPVLNAGAETEGIQFLKDDPSDLS